jgi:hypothetical protein
MRLAIKVSHIYRKTNNLEMDKICILQIMRTMHWRSPVVKYFEHFSGLASINDINNVNKFSK